MGMLADLGLDPQGFRRREPIKVREDEAPLNRDVVEEQPQGFDPVTPKELLGDGMLANVLTPESAAEIRTRPPESFYGILRQEFTQGIKAAVDVGSANQFIDPLQIGKQVLGVAQAVFSPITALGRRGGQATVDSLMEAGWSANWAAAAGTFVDLGINFFPIAAPARLIGKAATLAGQAGKLASAARGAKESSAVTELATKLASKKSGGMINELMDKFNFQTQTLYDGTVRKSIGLRELDDARGTLQQNATFNQALLITESSIEETTKTFARMGSEGSLVGNAIKRTRDAIDREVGVAMDTMRQSVKGFTKQESNVVVDLLDTGTTRFGVTPRAAQAVATLRKKFTELGERAKKAGIEITNPLDPSQKMPFQTLDNYFPHYLNDKALTAFELSPLAKQRAIQAIMDQENVRLLSSGKPAIGIGEAERRYRFLVHGIRKRKAPFEYSRTYNLDGWERNIDVALSRYYKDAITRVKNAEIFGAKGEGLNEIIGLLRKRFGNEAADFATTSINRAIGTETFDFAGKAAESVGRYLRGWQAFTKLGHAVIANSSQLTLTALQVGPLRTAKAIWKYNTNIEAQRSALRSGAILNSVFEDMMRNAGNAPLVSTQRWGRKVLELTQFSRVERANRGIASVAGQHFAQDTFRNIIMNPKHKRLGAWKSHLKKMGIDVDMAIKTGELSADDLGKAGQNIVNRTQFRIDSSELPLFWTGPWGKTISQFKSFGFKAGQAMKDDVAKPAIKYMATKGAEGDMVPLMRALTLLPIAGLAVNFFKDFFKGGSVDDDKGMILAVADAYAQIGTFGLMFDMIRGVQFGPQAVVGTALGPSASDLTAIIYGGGQLLLGKTDPMVNFLTSQIPVAGAVIRRQSRISKQTAAKRGRRTRRRRTRRSR